MLSPCSIDPTGFPTLSDVVRAVKHLPSAPRVLPRLKRLLRDGNSDLREIIRLVRLDPGLALRILQVANSPYFFTGSRCMTIDEAVSRVGYNEIYSLVSHAVAVQVLNRPLAVYALEADALWSRSVACALAAEALAGRTGDDRALVYTLGLLHCVGMIAIDEWARHAERPLELALEPFPLDATVSERRMLGFTQADAAAALLREWDFPDETIEPVRAQYALPGTTPFPQLTAVLIAAKWIAGAAMAPSPILRPRKPTPAQLVPVRLRPESLDGFVPAVRYEFQRVRAVLGAFVEDVVERQEFPSQNWAGGSAQWSQSSELTSGR